MNLSVKANLLQDVSPGAVREVAFRVRTEPIIPGSTLRGALATAWIRQYGIPTSANSKQAEFVALFESKVRFGYLYGPGCEVIPLSARRCKYRPDPGCRSFVIDDAEPKNEDLSAKQACDVCGGPLEASKGAVTIDTRTDRTRTQLTDDERAEDGKLFSRQVLAKGDLWTGRISTPDAQLSKELTALAAELVFLGGSKSTLGRAQLTLADSGEPPRPAEREDGLALVRLTSPGVFLDYFGRPTMDMPLGEVETILGLPTGNLSISKSWVRPTTVGGWHAASGLPKPTDWACSAGSTWLVAGIPKGHDLSALVHAALGFRLAEGNGAFTVNTPFQYNVASPAIQPATHLAAPLDDRVFALPDHELRWLIGELKAARTHLGTTGQPRPLGTPNRRTRSYMPEVFDAVQELLTTPRVDSLTQAINELQGALS